MKRMIVVLFVLCMKQISLAQNTIGIPNIINYSNQDYKAGRQNMDMAQDRSGMMYFANNNGLLCFDGAFWRTYVMPNATMVRSLAIDNDNKIYVGSQQELGYFSPATNGELFYTSLKGLISSADADFADVWNVQIVRHHVFFRSNLKIFEYTGRAIRVYKSNYWGFLGCAGSELLAYDCDKGLLYFNNGQWLPRIRTGSLPNGIQIRSIISIGNDSLLIASEANGLFILKNDAVTPFESKDIKEIAAKTIAGACLVVPGKIALNTMLGGCIVIDKKGKFIQRFTRSEGVQTNNVLSLFSDKDQNVWMGLDNGIDCIAYNNAIKNIFPEPVDRNSGYASIIYNNRLYLGTAGGLYTIDLSGAGKDLSYTTGSFSLVQNTTGQVWNVCDVNRTLLLGHAKGAFFVNDDKAVCFDARPGFWTFLPVYDTTSSAAIMAGTYNGVNIYHIKDKHVVQPNTYIAFESARYVIKDGNTIWVMHPYKGLYMISLDAQKMPVVTKYNDHEKILSKNHNHLYRVLDKMVITNDNGIFEYDRAKHDFVSSAYFNSLFGAMRVDYLKEDPAGNIWFCSNKRVGVIERTATRLQLVFIPELDNRVMPVGFEHIDVIDSNNVFIAAEKGFFHINYARYKKSKCLITTLIRRVEAPGKKARLIFGGYGEPGKDKAGAQIPYTYNALYFQCSTVVYGQQQNMTYSYYLKGFDKDWSAWTVKAEKEFTNLPPGRYVFEVKSRNNVDNESAVASFSFTILPPWYRTWWAYTLYAGLFAVMMYWFYTWQQRKFRRLEQQKLQRQQQRHRDQQDQLKILHELDLRKSEQAIVQLRNEKLQSEITHKNSQLASTAMNLVRKTEIFSKIKDDLNDIKNNEAFKAGSKDLEKMIRLIDGELDVTQEWEQFMEHFDQVHSNFLKKLKDHCPALTITELKLAAYLRLNLTSKEIAHLMNISHRGVETARYRLRKKLGLTSNEINLYDYLMSVTG